jgi:hypothetical protein
MSEALIVYGALGQKPVMQNEKGYNYPQTEFIVPDPTGTGFYPVYMIGQIPHVGPKESSIKDIRTKIYSASHDTGSQDLEKAFGKRVFLEYGSFKG